MAAILLIGFMIYESKEMPCGTPATPKKRRPTSTMEFTPPSPQILLDEDVLAQPSQTSGGLGITSMRFAGFRELRIPSVQKSLLSLRFKISRH